MKLTKSNKIAGMMRQQILPTIKETPKDFDDLEDLIRNLFKREIYLPLIKELKVKATLKNAVSDPVRDALGSGKIIFRNGSFRGKFNSTITKKLKQLGAVWDKPTSTFKIPLSNLPSEIQNEIRASLDRFNQTAKRIDARLTQILPSVVADKLKTEDFFDTTLYKTDRSIEQTLKGITVSPKLTDDQRAKIAKEYTQNLQKYITDWTAKEIVTLRQDIGKHVTSGGRYDEMAQTIQKRYDVSANKAKFLARQETGLMMAKFKETRYQSAGINEYIWRCVVGSSRSPVRPMHKKLDGRKFSWNNPPITDENGSRNNPGEDYNCRCTARPVIQF